ncbi:MAG: hypothetical protein HYX68_16355 [Planctomycetes bacterium]|nr:hypothetical protein [Planctomycetota bacterium]
MQTANETGVQVQPPLNLPPIAEAPPPVVKAVPIVEPVVEKPVAKPAAPVAGAPALLPKRGKIENPLIMLVAWIARFIVGVFMISNVFPLSFITAIAAFGWLQRRVQAVALRGWWRESPRRHDGTFNQFLDSLGPGAPVERPRWFWRERIVMSLEKMSRGNSARAFLRVGWTIATLPIHSLWLNFKVGIAGLLTTFMLTGWGGMIMLFSWYFGWLNSFHKGYEDAFLGLGMGLLGSLLLIVSLFYVPMAQAHQAAAGEIAAFFQFRVVFRLILTRMTAYVFLLAGLALTSLIFEIPRIFTVSDNFPANTAQTASEAFWLLEGYWFLCSIFFFFALISLRSYSALVYRSAMLKAVRAGTILTSDLPPRLALWFEKLEIIPQAQVPQHVIVAALKATISLKYRAFMFGIAFVFLLLFVMRFYVGYFLVFNEYRGILNHPVVQVPTIDWTPWHLVRGEEE